MEDVHGQRIVGYRHRCTYCEHLPLPPFQEPLLCYSVSLTTNTFSQAVFWVETKGKTLEEIDALFEGEKHSSVPDVEQVRKGQATLDVGAIEKQLQGNTEIVKYE